MRVRTVGRGARDAPFLVLAELDRLAQHLDALLAPLLTLEHPHGADDPPDEPALVVVALLEPLLAQLGEQLLELADRVLGLAGEVAREGPYCARVERLRDAREELGGRRGRGRGEGEVGARGVNGEEGRGRRVLVVGGDGVAVRACDVRAGWSVWVVLGEEKGAAPRCCSEAGGEVPQHPDGRARPPTSAVGHICLLGI